MLNVLFSSAGRRVELLRTFRRAYETLALEGRIVAIDIDPLAPALHVADRTFIVPRLNQPDYIPTLVEICQRESIGLIFPLIDPDIAILARHRAAFEAVGTRVAAVTPEASAITDDKWRTLEFFQGLGVTTPRSWLPNDESLADAEFPLFIKPRGGSAAQNTFKVRNARELDFFKQYVPDPIIQEFLPGPEITNDVVCDMEGELLGVISRERIEVRWGEVAKGVTVWDEAMAQACVKVARALPAIGPITVQCMMKNGVPHWTEINARLGGGFPLAVAAGADAPLWLLSRAAGLDFEVPPLGNYQTGLYLTRYDDSFLLTEAQREQMASRRL